MIDQQLATMAHLRPGGTLHLMVIPSSPTTGSLEPQRAVNMAFRVSAIVVFDDQIVPATTTAAEPRALVGTPFTRTPVAQSASYGYQAAVRLRPGADKSAFVRAATATATRILGPVKSNGQGGFNIIDLADQFAATSGRSPRRHSRWRPSPPSPGSSRWRSSPSCSAASSSWTRPSSRSCALWACPDAL